MAPEQIRSEKLDGRVDQFAWGVVAYELLTGKLPWRGAADPPAIAASILTDKPDEAAPRARSGSARRGRSGGGARARRWSIARSRRARRLAPATRPCTRSRCRTWHAA